jgi:hypothetical protein
VGKPKAPNPRPLASLLPSVLRVVNKPPPPPPPPPLALPPPPPQAVFNTHIDDIYEPRRFEHQLQALKQGRDLVAAGFRYVHSALDAPWRKELGQTFSLESLLQVRQKTPASTA